MNDCIGWDIGGAHLKVVRVAPDNTVVDAVQFPCPLWRGIDELREAYDRVPQVVGEKTYHAVTMTGEMADCFTNRNEGVKQIIQAMKPWLKKSFWVYAGAKGFLEPNAASCCSTEVASANWHATAACLSARIDQGILLDIGTTTTDIIPFCDGKVIDCGVADSERLAYGSLVYTGAVRTPVMAMVDTVQVGDTHLVTVAEHFAVAADVYCLLGYLSATDVLYPSCDNEDISPAASARRLARMFGYDYDGNLDFWRQVAQQIALKQVQKIVSAYKKVQKAVGFNGPIRLLGAGSGHFIARRVADCLADKMVSRYDDVATLLGLPKTSVNCASAAGVAYLLQGHLNSNESIIY